ncbi:MAG: hypothetical protein KDA81_09900 [Planctomycetaceae bacterium]|nr:hypothetical protein [Planctomycetaceae bacterium]
MTSTTTENFEHLALDGPVSLSSAVGIGLALAILFAALLWKERGIVGAGRATLFWILRTTAIAMVIWMLLAPSNVRTETATTRRTVAVLADVSSSMATIDAPDNIDDARWMAASKTSVSESASALTSADQAMAAAGLGHRSLEAAISDLAGHEAEGRIQKSMLTAERAFERVRQHVQHLQNSTDVPAAALSLASRVQTSLQSAELAEFSELCRILESRRSPAQAGWRESLPDLLHRVGSLRRSLSELARLVAESQPASALATNQKTSSESRLSRVVRLTEHLYQTAFTQLTETANVQLASFAATIGPVATDSDPAASLRAAHQFEAGLAADNRRENQTGSDSNPAPRTMSTTDISQALNAVQRDDEGSLAAVILLSDMSHNQPDAESPVQMAARLSGVPVHVVPVGSSRYVRDIALKSVDAPAVAMRNDDIVIEAHLQAYECEGEVCVLQLLQDGEVIDFREVPLDSGYVNRAVRFERQMPTIGNQTFQVAVVPVEGELTEDNNYDDFEVNVTRSDIKLLLSDELPRWEYRYLAQLFRRDNKIECDELLFQPRMIATGRRQESQSFPLTTDDWDQYDVVILGDLSSSRLAAESQESLIDYLRNRGGTLILIAGHEGMPHSFQSHPLEDVLPVSSAASSAASPTAGYAFRVTPEGLGHHALMIAETEDATRTSWDFINRFCPLHEISTWRVPRPTAHTLISAVPRDSIDVEADSAENAFLCWQPVGRGRVIYLSGPDTFRLRFLRGDRLHYRFWGQLIRWAIASDLTTGTRFVRIRTDKSSYDTHEDVHVTVRLSDADGNPLSAEGLAVRITSTDSAREVSLTPADDTAGEFHTTLTTMPAGIYRVEPIGTVVKELQRDETEPASVSFTVQANVPMEMVDTRCDRVLAQQIAELTGGLVVSPAAITEILALTDLEPIVTEKIETRPLWLEWKYLWIVFGCLQTEWMIRKWKGLS